MRSNWWDQKAGDWDIEVFKDDVSGEWISRVRFDTGMISDSGNTPWEAVKNIKAQWQAMGISGHFASHW